MSRIRIIVVFIFVFASFMFFGQEAEAYTELGPDDPIPSVWTKEGSPYIFPNYTSITTPVTIEPGVVVKFKMNASVSFASSVTAIGTEKEKIVFTAFTDDKYGGDTNGDFDSTNPTSGYWYRILIGSDATAQFENCLFLYGGEHPSGTLSLQPKTKKSISIRKSEFRHNKYAGIYIDYEPDQIIERNTFSDNGEGITLGDCYNKTTATISDNLFTDNINFGAKVTYSNQNTIDARKNWWGDWTGPYHSKLNPGGKGDRVSNGVLFDPWIGKEKPDPVIIVPGIMGSWEVNGEWKIDPIFHTYDDLLKAFVIAGYKDDGKSMSVFPYQWRDSNVENAKLLHTRIQKIKEDTGRPKVDIVAHSMGGLLAREYIESDYYEDDVDQLITVGTPHLGAPEAYMKWEGGAWLYNFFEMAQKSIIDYEAREYGFNDAYDYIRNRPVVSVKELLPSYSYLYDVENNYLLRNSYPIDYPQNIFLDNLNEAGNVGVLEKVEFSKIIGKTSTGESTIAGYNVFDSNIDDFWEYGVPQDFYNPLFVENGLVYSEGDETVPLYSAEANTIPSENVLTFSSKHNDLPTDAQQDILEILTGKRPETKIDEWQIDDIVAGFIFSPVDIQVVSPSGKRLGKDFETGGEFNEISGAYYTGFKTDTEFFVIPNPEDGEYKILTQGTGGGEYKIETTKITENLDDPENAKESSVIIEGNAQIGEIQEAKVEINGDQVVYNPDITPPTITILSPEEKDYNNDGILVIDYKVEDSGSGVASESWQVEKDGQVLSWQERSIDLSLEHLGKYTFKVSVMDEVENLADESAEFQIVTNISAIQNNLLHYFELGLVKKKVAYKYFDKKLKSLEKLLNLLEKTKNSNPKPKLKQAAVAALEKIINADIDQIIRQINRRSPQWIDQEAAELLIDSLDDIKVYKN